MSLGSTNPRLNIQFQVTGFAKSRIYFGVNRYQASRIFKPLSVSLKFCLTHLTFYNLEWTNKTEILDKNLRKTRFFNKKHA